MDERNKYVYNPHTLQFEETKLTTKQLLFRGIAIVSGVICTSIILIFVSSSLYTSPKEKALQRELNQMSMQYDVISNDMNLLASELNAIQEKDANIHRVILGMDP